MAIYKIAYDVIGIFDIKRKVCPIVITRDLQQFSFP